MYSVLRIELWFWKEWKSFYVDGDLSNVGRVVVNRSGMGS